MRKLVARLFDYSLNGLIATEGTEFFQFCRDLPDDPAEDAKGRELYAGPSMPHARSCSPARLRPPTGPTPQLLWANSARRSASPAVVATATSWSTAASASGARSCGST
jgi:hypothetical protein